MIVNKDINKLSTNKTVQQGRVGNVAYMFKLLGQIYIDKFNAIPREFISNAYDARIKAGTHNTPIVLSFNENPHNDHYTFAVRDYGSGMSPDLINNIYLGLGESEKNTSDDFTGGFGVGSKSFISYSEDTILNIETTYEGILYKYIAMINDDGFNLILNEEVETDEINGTLVYFEVLTKSDLDRFYKHSLFYSRFISNVILESNLSYSYLGSYETAKVDTYYKYGKGLLVANVPFHDQLKMNFYESPNFNPNTNYVNILINNVTYPLSLSVIQDLLSDNNISFDFHEFYSLHSSNFIYKVPNELMPYVKPQVNRSSIEIEEELALAIYEDVSSLYSEINEANDNYLINHELDEPNLVFDNFEEFQKYFVLKKDIVDTLVSAYASKNSINHTFKGNDGSFSLNISFGNVVTKFEYNSIIIDNKSYFVKTILRDINEITEVIINMFTNYNFRTIISKNNTIALKTIDENNNYLFKRKIKSLLYKHDNDSDYYKYDANSCDSLNNIKIGFYNSRLLSKYLPFIKDQLDIEYIIKYNLVNDDDIINNIPTLEKRRLFKKFIKAYDKNLVKHILHWFNTFIKSNITNGNIIDLNNVSDLVPKDDLIEGIKLYTIDKQLNDRYKFREINISLTDISSSDNLNHTNSYVYYDRRSEKELELSTTLYQIAKYQRLKIKLISSNLKDYEYITEYFHSNNLKFMNLKEFTNTNEWKSILTKYFCLKVRNNYHLINDHLIKSISDKNLKSVTKITKTEFLKQEFNYTLNNYPNQNTSRVNKKGLIEVDKLKSFLKEDHHPYILGIENDFRYRDNVISCHNNDKLTHYTLLYYLDPNLNNTILKFVNTYKESAFIKDNALESYLLKILTLIRNAKKEDKDKLIYKYFKVDAFNKAQEYVKAVSFLNYSDITTKLTPELYELIIDFCTSDKYSNITASNEVKINSIKHYFNSLKNYYIANQIINPCINYYIRKFDNQTIDTKYLIQELEFKFNSRKSRKSFKLIDFLQN